MSITPDTKDWTWVLERPCPECGFDPGGQGFDDLPGLVHDTAMAWSEVLTRPDAVRRPRPDVWSPLEYACHVRDVHVLFAERLRLMLDEGLSATSAAFEVGYESVSQFTREYRRMFQLPPKRDIQRARQPHPSTVDGSALAHRRRSAA